MLIKLEAKTPRAKSLALHPKRPWLLVALHSGAIQLWDYRMGTLLDEYHEHDGPARGCAFHPTQPLFASCGDDYTVRVYNYRTRRPLFALTGHMDYVRSVAFHLEAPWLMSASDDQTVRVWNWQSRQCVSVLTGHSHYVMCAQFHPREDLVVSASLDQTVRVWDISGLRRKGSSSVGGSPLDGYPASLSPRSSGQLDLFAPPDGAVKYILEGHDRGVNWVAFHPSKPLIVSASDDRTVKIWRYNDIRAWEIETLRGHQSNVSCVMFHPKLDLVLSDSEDKTLKIWDISSIGGSSGHRSASKCQTIRREDRFWSLAAHPDSNLLAYGHDSGFAVFKLERERPAYAISEDVVYYFQDKVLKSFPLSGMQGRSQSLMTADHRISLPASLAHNPAEDIILLSMNDESKYELYCLRLGDVKRGDGAFGVFTAKNRFAVLDRKTNTINILAIDNSVYRSFAPEFPVIRLLQATAGSLLLVSEEEVHWWDLQQGRSVFKLSLPNVKYVAWSPDNSKFALVAKSAVHIVDKGNPESSMVTIDEPQSVKSVVWSEQVLFMTNSHHLKYVLPNGDVGVVCTVDRPFYLLKAQNESVFVIDRSGSLQVITIDPSESVFKLALLKRDFPTVLQIIQTSPLVGQAIISYLRQNGFAEVALEFVKDAGSRFELAIEAGRLDIALQEAERLNSPDLWLRLGEEAMAVGDIEVAEAAYKNGGHDEKLSFLLLVAGQFEKMKRAEVGPAQSIHNQLLLGDWAALCDALREDAPCLAHVCARNAGDRETADQIVGGNGYTSVPCNSCEQPPSATPIVTAWPLTDAKDNRDSNLINSDWDAAKSSTIAESIVESAIRPVQAPPEAGGWGVGDDVLLEDDGDDAADSFEIVEAQKEAAFQLEQTLPGPGKPLFPIPSSSPLNCLINGDYEKCRQMLEAYGITHFDPLLLTIEKLIMSSRVYIDGHCDYPLTDVEGQVQNVTANIMLASHRQALGLATSGQFREAMDIFSQVFYLTFFCSDCEDIQHEAVEYLRGLSMELVKRELSPEDTARSLELACFFTHCKLREEHCILSLRSAMTTAYKAQCLRLAGRLARRLLDYKLSEQVSTQARKLLALAEKAKEDPILIDYDPLQVPFRMCQQKMVQLRGPGGQCPVCHTEYSEHLTSCLVCNLCSL